MASSIELKFIRISFPVVISILVKPSNLAKNDVYLFKYKILTNFQLVLYEYFIWISSKAICRKCLFVP